MSVCHYIKVIRWLRKGAGRGKVSNLGSSFLGLKLYPEREMGQWAVYYSSPKSFINTFLFGILTTLGTSVTFDWLVLKRFNH